MNNGRGSAWIKKMEKLIIENNLDIPSYKYGGKNETLHELLSHNRLKIILRDNCKPALLRNAIQKLLT